MQAASSDMLWQQLYHERWHCNPTSHDMLDVSTAFQPAPVHHSRASQPSTLHQHSTADPESSKSSWLQLYQKRHTAECQMQCPHCRQPKIVPVVYGFPSHLLTLAMRADMLRMGNDHLIDGQPVWTCTSCCVELSDFPFPILSQH